MSTARGLRYLWVFSAADEWTVGWHARLLERRRAAGFDVEGFCNTPASLKRRWLPFPELDRRWRTGDPALMEMYESLAWKLDGRDVLILYNGANLHPEFVTWFDLLKVYTAGDDPESTEVLTRPVAPAFDVHLVNNIACLDMYRSWGLKNVHFWPLGSLSTRDDVSDLDGTAVLDSGCRPVRIVFVGEYQSRRKDRFDAVTGAFPDAYCAGRGWPRGYVSWDELWALYRKSQIGWNFHNSTGPVNFRTYELPAHGILQICDNKSHLGKIFELDREAVGFDTTEECIDKTRYYLAHPKEQRAIALAGRKRWENDYHPDRVWEKLVEIVQRHWGERQTNPDRRSADRGIESLKRHRNGGLGKRLQALPGKLFRAVLGD